MQSFFIFLVMIITSQGFAQLAPQEINLVITHGQSLSVGNSVSASPNVSVVTEFPNNSFTLDANSAAINSFGWTLNQADPTKIIGFTPYYQRVSHSESPGSGILSSLLALHQRDGKALPVYVHINGGYAGRSIVELMLRQQRDFYPTVQDGLNGTAEGMPFYIPNSNGGYSFYVKTNGAAVSAIVGAGPTKPVYYENILTQVRSAVAIAALNGYVINPNINVVWIQGQNDTSTKNYKTLLSGLLNNLQSDLQQETQLGASLNMQTFISQLRGSPGKERAIDQFELTLQRPNTHLAAQESWISNGFGLSGGTSTHLHKVGYRVLGEQIGNSIYEYYNTGNISFAKMTSLTYVGSNQVVVQFSNLRGQLVEDNSALQVSGFQIPPNFGFYLYGTGGAAITSPKITSAVIVGPDQVELTFSSNVKSTIYLYLGRNQTLMLPAIAYSYHTGTTLRDSVQDDFYGYNLSAPKFIGNKIPRYAPIQRLIMPKW